MATTFAYLRVSENDDALTLADQRAELEKAGYRVDFWHEDTISGGVQAMARPGFVSMVEKMRVGETLIVLKLDRLGRDAADVMATVRTLAERGIRVTVRALAGVELSSATGDLLVSILAAVAQMERELHVERTRAGIARARSKGKAIGRPPKTTPEQRADMVACLAVGASVSAVARAFSVSRATVIAVRAAESRVRHDLLSAQSTSRRSSPPPAELKRTATLDGARA